MKTRYKIIAVAFVFSALIGGAFAANELNVNTTFTFTKNGATLQRSISGNVTVSGNISQYGVQTIGTSDETIPLGDVGTIGYVYIHNLDATNFVIFGSDGSVYPNKAKATEPALVRWNGAAVHIKANSGACKVEYAIIED